jgi:DNA modification methylase
VAQCLVKYRKVLLIERTCKLLRADLLVELIDGHGLRAIDIARETGERQSDLSQMYRTAKDFPLESRLQGAVYNTLMLGSWMARRFPDLGFSPAAAVEEIVRAGLSQHRDVTRHFGQLTRLAMQDRRLLPSPTHAGQLFDRAHHCRFQDLLNCFPDGSSKLLSCDPPYVYHDETYRSRSARSRACDNDEPEAAVAQVVDLLRDWQPKLAPGGVLLLWQPWQNLLRPIDDAIAEYHWEVLGPVIWDKGRPQPGRFDSPYSRHGEMLWVLHRPGELLEDHDGSSREMILRFPPVSFPSLADGQNHCYEKPLPLCERLLLKHTGPSDVVFDACGCTGPMSVAAIRHGRRWAYAESNAENYRIGAARIAEEFARLTTIAG